MASAVVGDDLYGEDPTAQRLEARAAELLGQEAALFVTSGTMANQLALMLRCRRGDEVVVGMDSHCALYESGAAGALAGVQLAPVGRGGLFTAEELEAAVHPPDAYMLPRTSLVALENTHNRAGGVVWPRAQALEVCARARSLGLGTHLDGARVWNAAAALGCSPGALASPFDTVSACFSKGLGAPVGSVLAGPADLLREARRLRKMLGGAMRQVGVLCAAALYALDHHLERLAEDHANARRLADALASVDGVELDLGSVQTNIVNFQVSDAHALVTRAREEGVLVSATTSSTVRAVTHLDVDAQSVARAIGVLTRAARRS
jgi:threonine aldolase